MKRGPLSSSLPLVVAHGLFSSSTALLLAVIVTCSFAENVLGEIDTLGTVQRKQRQIRKTKRHSPDNPQGHAINRPLHMVCLISQMIFSYRTGVYLSMIFGANFSSESGPEIPVNVSLIIRFGGHVTIKKGPT